MNRPRYHFRGVPEFVEAAAGRLGRPELAGPARRIEALAALATLCAQAAEADGDADGTHAAAILRQAAGFRDQLRIAAEAADAMLAAVALGCDPRSAPDGGPMPDATPSRARSRRRAPKDRPSGQPS